MQPSFLLDTHTLLWFLSGDDSLSENVKSIILDRSNKSFISIASLWEIAIKINLGKLTLDTDFREFANLLYDNDIEILQITFDHVLELMHLEIIHRDPFDRIIISQSKFEGLTLLSKDQHFKGYKELDVIW